VELVCSKQPYGSWISRAIASVMLAAGVGSTAMRLLTLEGTTVAGMVMVGETVPPLASSPPAPTE